MTLSNELSNSLETLARLSDSVRAVTMKDSGSDNRFTNAIHALDTLARENDLPVAIVGDLGTIRYGYPAVTEDIDVVIAQHQLDKLLVIAPDYGFRVAWKSESGWHTLTHQNVKLNIVPEGGKARNDSPTTIPGPGELGVHSGVGYASLDRWLELKISARRRKDQTHVVEVLKVCSPQAIANARTHLASVHQSYLELFDQLATEAAAEKQQEDERSKRR